MTDRYVVYDRYNLIQAIERLAARAGVEPSLETIALANLQRTEAAAWALVDDDKQPRLFGLGVYSSAEAATRGLRIHQARHCTLNAAPNGVHHE